MRRWVLIINFFVAVQALSQTGGFYHEKYRPQFHFTPAIHWTNDPNGLVYFNGEYHLFYQYNPFGNRWGHMSWGHAISTDLLHWQHLPVAIPEEKDTMIFSGTCVADLKNSSGFATRPGQIPLVAIYTGHIENVSQTQHLAYSLDSGRTWTKYNHNPILDIGSKEFRDPQVFWYAPGNKWIMTLVLATEKKARFYGSANLKKWEILGEFGPAGDTNGVWECPDLLEVPVEGEPGKSKWVLMHSPSPYMQYFVGEFDGSHFVSENPARKIFRPDYGPDYYAAITYKNLPPHSSPVSIGWVNNWNYANDIPTTPWKSAMSLPRILSVKKIDGEWILIQKPISSINSLRKKLLESWGSRSISGTTKLSTHSRTTEIELTMNPGNSKACGIRVGVGNGHAVEIGYNRATREVYIDRSKSANQDFNERFRQLSRYPTVIPGSAENVSLRVFIDESIIEVFVNGGEAALTAQFFPDDADSGIELFSNGGKANFLSLKAWLLTGVW